MRWAVHLAAALGACLGAAGETPEASGEEEAARPQVIVRSSPNHFAPENTVAAAVLATAMGADFAEVDVRTSRDGALFLLHDADLRRTTGEGGTIQTRMAGAIDALDGGAAYDPVFAGERVPRLDAYLAETAGTIGVCVTVRQARPEAVASALIAAGVDEECLIRAGTGPRAAAFRAALPGAKITLPVRSAEGALRAKEAFGADIVECRWGDMTADFVAACREAGLGILIGYDGESPEAVTAILGSGADYVLTSRPELFATPKPVLPAAPEAPSAGDGAAEEEPAAPGEGDAAAEPAAPEESTETPTESTETVEVEAP